MTTPPFQKPDAPAPAVPLAAMIAEDRRSREQLCSEAVAKALEQYRCRTLIQRTEQFDGSGSLSVRWVVVMDALP